MALWHGKTHRWIWEGGARQTLGVIRGYTPQENFEIWSLCLFEMAKTAGLIGMQLSSSI
jgi:hypothetical protein